jgi:citrate synthase
MPDKPVKGLADVVAASTALSDIDGAAGRLFYRGYDIHDLAGRISFEECVHLLVRGALPTQEQLAALTAELDAARESRRRPRASSTRSAPRAARWRRCARCCRRERRRPGQGLQRPRRQ